MSGKRKAFIFGELYFLLVHILWLPVIFRKILNFFVHFSLVDCYISTIFGILENNSCLKWVFLHGTFCILKNILFSLFYCVHNLRLYIGFGTVCTVLLFYFIYCRMFNFLQYLLLLSVYTFFYYLFSPL